MGHVRADCPSLKAAIEEAYAVPRVVIGTFLINSVLSLVFFDSGATSSFVLITFSGQLM